MQTLPLTVLNRLLIGARLESPMPIKLPEAPTWRVFWFVRASYLGMQEAKSALGGVVDRKAHFTFKEEPRDEVITRLLKLFKD